MDKDKPTGGARRAPVYTVRAGNIAGAAWRNAHEDGSIWYSVTLTRHYQDATGTWKKAVTFGRDDLLVVAEVCRAIWAWILQQGGPIPLTPVED